MTGTVAPSIKTLSESCQDNFALNELIPVPATAILIPSMRIEPDAAPPAITWIFTKWLSASIVFEQTVNAVAVTLISAALALVSLIGDGSITSVRGAAG